MRRRGHDTEAVTSAVERAVDSLSDPAVGLPDALRTLLVVAKRIDADELTTWLRGELDGYEADVAVPSYRDASDMPIELHFDGPMQSFQTMTVTRKELPDELGGVMDHMDLRAPIAELVALSSGDQDPVMQLSTAWVARYRTLASEGRAPRYMYMTLNRAAVKIPATHLKGILDRIKTTALDLALSLEDVSPQAGDSGGPTVVDEPRLAQQVNIHLTQLFADGATITVGDNATVASGPGAVAVQLQVGDVEGLLAAAAGLLGADGVAALEQALADDGGSPGANTQTFLERVKGGAYMLVGGIGTNAAYVGLVELLKQVFGG